MTAPVNTPPAASAPDKAGGGTQVRILDGALAAMATFGLARFSLEDVARRAGLSRQTVYRYFPSKAALLAATVAREQEAFMANSLAAAAGKADVAEMLEAVIAATLDTAAGHVLLQQLLEAERDSVVSLLTGEDAVVVRGGRAVLTALIAERHPHADPVTVARAADACARLLVSYVLTPPDVPARQLARELAALLAPRGAW